MLVNNLKIAFETISLNIGYAKEIILENVNLRIFQGDRCCLIGSNGSGKTSLVKTISRIGKPISGKINYSKDILISNVPQFKKIQFHYPITVEKMLLLDNNFYFKNKNLDEFEILVKLRILDYKNKLIRECSGGQLQKVLIARSILSKANLIFFDEPLDAIDEKSKKIVLEEFEKESKNKERTFFVITHNLDNTWLKNFNRVFQIQNNMVIE